MSVIKTDEREIYKLLKQVLDNCAQMLVIGPVFLGLDVSIGNTRLGTNYKMPDCKKATSIMRVPKEAPL